MEQLEIRQVDRGTDNAYDIRKGWVEWTCRHHLGQIENTICFLNDTRQIKGCDFEEKTMFSNVIMKIHLKSANACKLLENIH